MQLWVVGKEMTPRKLLMILMTGNWGSFTMLLGIIDKLLSIPLLIYFIPFRSAPSSTSSKLARALALAI